MIVKGNREIDNASAPALKQAEVEQCGGSGRRGISIWVCDNVMAPCKVKKKKMYTCQTWIDRYSKDKQIWRKLKGQKKEKIGYFFFLKMGIEL